MKLTISTKGLVPDVGIVYVLLIYLEGKELVKIGITSGKVEDRVASILKAIWARYREFPRCIVKRYRTTDGIRAKEKELHTLFADYKYNTEFSFGGSTEFFEVPLADVVTAYDDRIPK